MTFCGTWLIFVQAIATGILLYWVFFSYMGNPVVKSAPMFWRNVSFMVFVIVLGVAINWAIGFFAKKRRPIVEFPETVQLAKTFSTWKSFPSDHTTIAFLLAGPAVYLGGLIGVIFGTMAVLVAVGRVYVGVHYPRDILGGIVTAFLAVFIMMLLPIALY